MALFLGFSRLEAFVCCHCTLLRPMTKNEGEDMRGEYADVYMNTSYHEFKMITEWPHSYFSVYWWWLELECWYSDKHWAVILVKVIQQWCERGIKVTISGWH